MTKPRLRKLEAERRQLELLTDCRGFIKVRLRYATLQPLHARSLMLKNQCLLDGPYFEDVYALIPQRLTFPILEAFLPSFHTLKENGYVDETAMLKDVKIMDEDITTLAYKVN